MSTLIVHILHLSYFSIIFKAAEEEAKGEVFKAWIGLRAEGDETEVEWAWSNGRPLGAETFTESQVMRFNEDAARKNKKCIVARVEYNQVNKLIFENEAISNV